MVFIISIWFDVIGCEGKLSFSINSTEVKFCCRGDAKASELDLVNYFELLLLLENSEFSGFL